MAFATMISVVIIVGQLVSTELVQGAGSIASLKGQSVPKPSNLGEFVKDEAALVQLGKALFWDIQIGSDRNTSCATCHFHSGADNRYRNQISPGLLRMNLYSNGEFEPNPDTTFTNPHAPDYNLQTGDFPLGKDDNDVISSQGVHFAKYDQATGTSTPEPDAVFNVNGLNTRRVEPRNTPSVINAVFNFRNFWDGRAQNDFNGVNPFGSRDPNAVVLKAKNNDNGGKLSTVKISLDNSSLASQAVGPPTSAFEMSADGRIFPDISRNLRRNRKPESQVAKRKLSMRALANQTVHPDDSVLGSLRDSSKKGLTKTYRQMVKEAFKNRWWRNSNQLVTIDEAGNFTFITKPEDQAGLNEFTQMEVNFPLFFGLAVQAYEATLVSDDTPMDRYLSGDQGALTAQEVRGMDVFLNQGKCVSCHAGAELTKASVSNVRNEPIERMVMGDGNVAVYDNGFYNIGVRPTEDDLGVGGKDPFGNPLSFSKLFQRQGKDINVQAEPPAESGSLQSNERVAVNGAFKTPGLRNVALTPPYFHNGGKLTLEQVVEFYNRGGDFANQTDKDADIENLDLSQKEQADLVAFLKSMTDERVVYDKAPFDHPELPIPDGHKGNTNAAMDKNSDRFADDKQIVIPAVGTSGWQGSPNFLNVSFTRSAATDSSGSTAPLGGGLTAEDANCPVGTTYVPAPGGFLCQQQ
ncbi:MAG: cytochrome-c peroxidase [Microcoleaceae cyanobacterium]